VLFLSPLANKGFVALSSKDDVAEGAPLGQAGTPPLRDQTILVVDDDNALRTTTVLMLKCRGFKTLTAVNGLEALRQMEENPQIDAVLLDLLMPVMDGEETFRQIRNFWAATPVILISGFDGSKVCQSFANSPPDGFVQKPFTLAKLTGALSRVLA